MQIMKSARLIQTLFVVMLFACPIKVFADTYYFKVIDKDFDDIARRLYRMDFDNERMNITAEDINRLERIAKKRGSKQLEARFLYWRVRATQMEASPGYCIPLLEKAQRICQPEYDYDRAVIDYQLAGNYERKGDYLRAYVLLNSTIPVFNKYGDHFFLGNAHLLFAQLYIDINDPENAKVSLKEARYEYEKAGFPLNRIYFFEALLADKPQKLALYKKSLTNGGEKDWGMTLQALTKISMLFVERNLTDSAMLYDRKARLTLDKNAPDNPVFEAVYNINHIRVLYAMKRYSEALEILKQEEKKKLMKSERFLVDIYEMLWKVYDKLGDKENAYTYLKMYTIEYQRCEEQIRRQDVPKAKAREAIARRNDTIRLLEKDAELSRTFMYMVILFAAIILSAGVAVFIYFWQRYKIRRMENRELRNSLQQESLIYSVNRRNFERDIKQKNCEISSSTLLLANKNEVLQQISEITKRYSDERQIPQEYVRQINEVIGDSLKNDDEWSRFKLHFDSVHPNFFVKLKDSSGELTENDLRLCAYIRIGMRAKQIAEMLSVSPDSINSNRYRLRKKLGLLHGESLDDFIRKI